MSRMSSQLKDSETFDVVLSGGSPWGFTLDGGCEFRKKLSVSKITHGGKADVSQSIAVGDEILAINGIDCISRAEAMELVRCSRQKLKISLRREGVAGPLKQSNGPTVKKSMDIVPNLYKTAAEHLSNSDFYSTYNVDRKKYAQITQNQNIYASTDNLSSSLDDLLESCRQGSQKQPNMANSTVMGQANDRLSSSAMEIANGRRSPSPEFDGLSGISLPEGNWPVIHQRTYTSPGRIQKVTVKSTNISVSPQKGSPPGRDTERQQAPRAGVSQDDWVGRWLLEEPKRVTPINAGAVHYREKSKDQDKEIPDRRISLHERPEGRKSQSLPRSKSFGGPTSYGVTVRATAVKRNEGSSTLPPSSSPNRYSSSGLIQEKAARPTSSSGARPGEAPSRPVEMQWNSLVYAAPGDTVEVRLPRETVAPRMTISESTSSLDGTMDSSTGGARRQCPVPPPRSSVSSLLSSFRKQGRRLVPEEIPPRFGAVSRISESASNQPIHSQSRSWPTANVVESKPTGSEVTRQSWHAEPAVMTGQSRREANSSISSTSSDITPEKKVSKSSSIRVKSSVVIRNMRSSSSSSVDENAGPTVYRSGQVSPDGENNRSRTLPPRKKVSAGNPPGKSIGDTGLWMTQNKRNAETEPRGIEDTQILQRLLRDKANDAEPATSVKSKIANFEGGMKREAFGGPPFQDPGRRIQNRSFSQGKIEVQRSLKSYSSMDSLLETRRSKFNETSADKEGRSPERYPARLSETTEKRGVTLPDTRSSKQFSETSTEKRGSLMDARTPTNLRTTPAGNDDSQLDSRSSVKIYTTKQEGAVESDNTPRKQWEKIDNFSRSRPDYILKAPSSSSFGVKNGSETEEQKPDLRQNRQHTIENPLRKHETTASLENKVNSEMERTAPPNNTSSLSRFPESDFKPKPVEPELPPSSSNDDNEVFWDADDSLPPPPPLQLLDPLETSQDSLPLPSPPREVLVEFPTSYEDYNSRSISVQRESALTDQDIVKPEEVAMVESSPGNVGEEPRVEFNGPGKFDSSVVSEQPLETTSSTEFSFHANISSENKRDSHRAPPPSPLIITSTPTKDEGGEMDTPLDNSASPYSVCSTSSTPSGSRPNSILSPKLEALDKEKSVLLESMKQKIIDLRSQMNEIKDEIDGNEELGEKVTKVVERKASPAEFSKYQLFTGELNKIIGLLLILTQRMHRYEMMLNDLDMSEEADRQQRDILLSKIDKVTLQHEEACKIKEVNDKRGEAVSKILENCLEEEEFADFQYYIDMKTQLALMHAEIRDKVKMGEERLNTLTSTKIDWSIFSLT